MGQNRASKSLLHITPRISRFLQSFQQIKLLKDNSSRQNPLAIVVFLGWPYYISIPGTSNRNFIVLFHNSISSWNSSYLYGRLILSRANLYQTVCSSSMPDELSRCSYHFFIVAVYFSDYHWIFYVDLSWSTRPICFNWNFMVDTFIPTHRQSKLIWRLWQ